MQVALLPAALPPFTAVQMRTVISVVPGTSSSDAMQPKVADVDSFLRGTLLLWGLAWHPWCLYAG